MQTFSYSSQNIEPQNNFKKFDIDISLCLLLAFSLPITNFIVSIFGIRIEPQRFLMTLCILRMVIHICFTSTNELKRHKLLWKVFFPVLIVIVYAFFLSLFQPDYIESIRTASQSDIYGFIFKRATKYLSYLILSVYLALVLNSENKVHAVLCSLATALCITEVLGLIQSFVFLVGGIDILPINRSSITTDSIITQSVAIKFLGLNFLRINSLTNEPKVLGIVTTFLLFMKLYWNRYRQNQGFRMVRFLDSYMSTTLWLSLVVILLTFSGSGLISLSFGLALFIFTSGKSIFSFKGNTLIYLTFFFAILVILSIFSTTLSDKIDSFLQASILRRLGGFTTDSSLESFYASVDPEDGAALYNILNFPNAVIFGFGFGAYSNISMVYYNLYYPDGFSPFSRSILIETVFSVGVPGLIVLSYFLYKINIKFILRKHFLVNYPLQLMLNQIVVINFFLRTMEPVFFATLGILASIYLNHICLLRQVQKSKLQHEIN